MTQQTNLQEFKASFGVNAEIPGPVETGDKGKLKGGAKDPAESLGTTPGDVKPVGSSGAENMATLKPKSKTIKEEIELVFEGADLSEDFIDKAAIIFEAAVSARADAQREEIREEMQEELDEAIETITSDLSEKVKSYLNHVVEQWAEDNKVAIEENVRTDISESFLSGMKELFVEHYVSVPEGAEDIVESLSDDLDGVNEALNDAVNENIALREYAEDLEKALAFNSITEGLTDVQVEKLQTLVEGVQTDSIEEFENALVTIKESYLTGKTLAVGAVEQLSEEVEIVEDVYKPASNDSFVNAVSNTLSRTLKN